MDGQHLAARDRFTKPCTFASQDFAISAITNTQPGLINDAEMAMRKRLLTKNPGTDD